MPTPPNPSLPRAGFLVPREPCAKKLATVARPVGCQIPCKSVPSPARAYTTNRESTYAVNIGQSVVIHGNEQKLWLSGDGGHVLVQNITGTISPFSSVDLPHDLYTTDKEGFRRLRVDPGQTGFFEGREQRAFYEFSIPVNNSVWLKFTSPVDFVLFEQSLEVDAGAIRFEAKSGATETGTFSNVVATFPKNSMSTRPSPFYVSQVSLRSFSGATASPPITGGTVREVFRVVTVSATAQQRSVGGAAQSERGLAAGTYYLELRNIASSGDAKGVYSLIWEERLTS